jgi:thymidylate kinase
MSPASDLDVAVRPESLAAVSRVLAEQEDFRCVQVLRHESTCSYFVLAISDGPATRFRALDVATDFRRNGRVFMTADELLRGRTRQGPVWVASPSAELPYIVVKKILKGAVPPHQRDRLRSLLTELGPEGERIVQRLLGGELGSSTVRRILGMEWEAVLDTLPGLRRSLRRSSFLRRPVGSAGYLAADARRIALRFLQPTGLCVAVMGPDGAGKSTLIRRLGVDAGAAFRASRSFHLRPGVLASRGSEDPSRPHERRPYGRLVSVLKMAYLVLDYSLGFLFRVRPALVRSSLVLFDRYIDDVEVDPLRYRFAKPRWALRAARWLVPRPDLHFILDVPVDRLLARKGELPASELVRQRSAYLRLAAALPNSFVLDGSLSAEEVARTAVESLVLSMKERHLARSRFRSRGRDSLRWLRRALGERLPSAAAAGRPPGSRAFALLSLRDGRGFLIPRDNRRAASGALRLYSAQNPMAKAAKSLLGAALRAGAVPPFLSRVDDAGGPRLSGLFERIEELFGERGLHYAVSLGTPGPSRKPVIQVMDAAGKARGFVKVGWDAETEGLAKNEAQTLEGLAGASVRTFVRPELLHAGGWNGLFLLATAPPPPPLRGASGELTRQCLAVLAEMRGTKCTLQHLENSAFWKKLGDRAARAALTRDRGVLSRGMRYLSARLAGLPIPFHLAHGDFAPWNMLQANERIFLFDWEQADWEAPAGYDLFHFLVQTGSLLKRRGPGEIFESLLDGHNPALENLAGGRELATPLLLLYLMDRITLYARRPDAHIRTLSRLSALASLCMDKEVGSR